MARLDLRKYVVNGQFEKLVRFWTKVMEVMAVRLREAQDQAVKTNQKEPTQFISILDFQGFNSRQHLGCIRVWKEWVTLSETHYPETAKYLLFINTPRIAFPLIEVMRPLFSRASLKAFRLFGQDPREWTSFLLKIINKDQLPFQMGGTKTTPKSRVQ